MPLYCTESAISAGLDREVIPVLETLANNPTKLARSRRRLEREELPDYESSTEEEWEDEENLTRHKIEQLLEGPLNPEERENGIFSLCETRKAYNPKFKYNGEVAAERERIESWLRYEASPNVFWYFQQVGLVSEMRAGIERVNIIARHNIKRRWQKLGVWNPEWGIPADPECKRPANDDRSEWKWAWQTDSEAPEDWHECDEGLELAQQHPAMRALSLRKGLCRSQHVEIVPHNHLEDGTSAAQAESFITSRPWFQRAVEITEELERSCRLTARQIIAKNNQENHIRTRLQGRPEWQFGLSGDLLRGWKWAHESPSPEREDLSGLEDLTTFELTPSEVDALHDVAPPTPRICYNIHDGPGFQLDGNRARVDLPPRSGMPAARKSSPHMRELPLSRPQKARRQQQQQQQRWRRRRQEPQPAQTLRRSARIAAVASKESKPIPLSTQWKPQMPLPSVRGRGQGAQRVRQTRSKTTAKSQQSRPTKASDAAGISKTQIQRKSRRRRS